MMIDISFSITRWSIFLVYLFSLKFSSSFHLSNKICKQRISILSQSSLLMATIPPRKELFFEIIESGLKDRFPNTENIHRVFQFCKYAKSIVPLPVVTEKMHEPCEEYIDNLTAKPWWDCTEFPSWLPDLEANSKYIRDELQSVLKKEDELFKGDSRYMGTMGAGWTAFRLQRLGEWNRANTAIFPETTRIVKSLNIPLAVRGVMIAKQLPGSGVKPHSDGRNFILTCHLGLEIPEDCSITVAGQKKNWKQDKAIIFDTSFIHETENNSNQSRYVLIVDFWHPELSNEERSALEFIYDARNKFETGKVEDIDCSWVANGNPITVNDYLKSKSGFGKVFVDFFSDGGLVKFNPFK